MRRFLDTKLSDQDFFELFKYIKKNKFLTSCTPFDEKSVDKIEKFNFDFIKIASVSALDFNLHERVVLRLQQYKLQRKQRKKERKSESNS